MKSFRDRYPVAIVYLNILMAATWFTEFNCGFLYFIKKSIKYCSNFCAVHRPWLNCVALLCNKTIWQPSGLYKKKLELYIWFHIWNGRYYTQVILNIKIVSFDTIIIFNHARKLSQIMWIVWYNSHEICYDNIHYVWSCLNTQQTSEIVEMRYRIKIVILAGE